MSAEPRLEARAHRQAGYSPRMRFGLSSICPLLAALVLGGLAFSGCTGESADASQSKEPAPPAHVAVAPLRVRPMSQLYRTSARLRARSRAAVTARTRGVIERILVEEGDRVKAGAVLLQLESADQTIEREAASDAFNDREAAWKRAQSLSLRAALTQDALREARLAYHEARHRLARADLALARTTIRAPFAGLVVLRHTEPGQRVDDGTPLLDLADVSVLEADVAVPERHVPRLSVGQSARLVSEGSPSPARIARIAPTVDPMSGTVKVTLRAEPSLRLRPGSFVRVAIEIASHADSLVLPRSALVAEGGSWHVFRLPPGATTVQRVNVELGFEDGPWVEVKADGLAPGQPIVVRGASALAEGSPVTSEPAKGLAPVSSKTD